MKPQKERKRAPEIIIADHSDKNMLEYQNTDAKRLVCAPALIRLFESTAPLQPFLQTMLVFRNRAALIFRSGLFRIHFYAADVRTLE